MLTHTCTHVHRHTPPASSRSHPLTSFSQCTSCLPRYLSWAPILEHIGGPFLSYPHDSWSVSVLPPEWQGYRSNSSSSYYDLKSQGTSTTASITSMSLPPCSPCLGLFLSVCLSLFCLWLPLSLPCPDGLSYVSRSFL